MQRRGLVVITTLLLSAGCGSKAATSSGASTSAAATTTAAGGATSVVDDAPSTTDANFSGKGSKEFCSLLKKVSEDDSLLSSTDTAPATLKANFTEILGTGKELESKAPNEIKADVSAFVSFFKEFDAVLRKVDYDIMKLGEDAATAAEFQKLSVEFEPAVNRLTQYTEKVCGITG